MKLFGRFATAAVALVIANTVLPVSQARAGFMTYTDKNAFLAAVSGAVTDTFEDLSTGSKTNPLNRTVGSYSYSAVADGTNLYVIGAFDRLLTTDAQKKR